jgi:hypothetical protein
MDTIINVVILWKGSCTMQCNGTIYKSAMNLDLLWEIDVTTMFMQEYMEYFCSISKDLYI